MSSFSGHPVGCADPAGPPVSPLAGVVFLNEFMASNDSTIADEAGDFDTKCNMEMVELEKLEHAEEIAVVKGLIEEHLQHTGSAVAERLLGDWENTVETFVKVMPTDYRRVISQTGDLSVGVPGPDAVQPRDRPAAE